MDNDRDTRARVVAHELRGADWPDVGDFGREHDDACDRITAYVAEHASALAELQRQRDVCETEWKASDRALRLEATDAEEARRALAAMTDRAERAEADAGELKRLNHFCLARAADTELASAELRAEVERLKQHVASLEGARHADVVALETALAGVKEERDRIPTSRVTVEGMTGTLGTGSASGGERCGTCGGSGHDGTDCIRACTGCDGAPDCKCGCHKCPRCAGTGTATKGRDER